MFTVKGDGIDINLTIVSKLNDEISFLKQKDRLYSFYKGKCYDLTKLNSLMQYKYFDWSHNLDLTNEEITFVSILLNDNYFMSQDDLDLFETLKKLYPDELNEIL